MELKYIFQLTIILKSLSSIKCSVKLLDFEIISNNVIHNGAANYSIKVKEKCKLKYLLYVIFSHWFNCISSI